MSDIEDLFQVVAALEPLSGSWGTCRRFVVTRKDDEEEPSKRSHSGRKKDSPSEPRFYCEARLYPMTPLLEDQPNESKEGRSKKEDDFVPVEGFHLRHEATLRQQLCKATKGQIARQLVKSWRDSKGHFIVLLPLWGSEDTTEEDVASTTAAANEPKPKMGFTIEDQLKEPSTALATDTVRSLADLNELLVATGTVWPEKLIWKLLKTVAKHLQTLQTQGYVHGCVNMSTIEVYGAFTPPPSELGNGRERQGTIDFGLASLGHCQLQRDLVADRRNVQRLAYLDSAIFPNKQPPHLAPELFRFAGYAHTYKDDLNEMPFEITDFTAVDVYHLGLVALELALGRGIALPSARSKQWQDFLSLRMRNNRGHLATLLDALTDRGYSPSLQAFITQMLQTAPTQRPTPGVLRGTMQFLKVESDANSHKRAANNSATRPAASSVVASTAPEPEHTKTPPTPPNGSPQRGIAQKFALRTVTAYSAKRRRDIRAVLNAATASLDAKSQRSIADGGAPPLLKLAGVHNEYYLDSGLGPAMGVAPRPVSFGGSSSARRSTAARASFLIAGPHPPPSQIKRPGSSRSMGSRRGSTVGGASNRGSEPAPHFVEEEFSL